MEHLLYFISTLIFVFILKFLLFDRIRSKNAPPGPPPLPIIGHLHLAKEPFHRTLQRLSNQYGPIVSLKFGCQDVLLVSSPDLAEECFNKNDIVFANRPLRSSGKRLNYDNTTIGTAPYGELWRNLRRVASIEIFSTSRLNSFLGVRKDEVRILLRNLYKDSQRNFTKVEMKSRLSELSFNIVMRMITGKQYFGAEAEDIEEAERFRDIIERMFEVAGTSNPGDFFPVLKWIDYGGWEKKMREIQKESDEFCQTLVDEHRRSHLQGVGGTKTMIDTMLSLQEIEPHLYSDKIIKGMIMTMLAAGTDTSTVTIEWAMSLLLNHPSALKKAAAELDSVVGNERLVEESDYSKLQYLQSVLNETFRLYPAAPLLLPHHSSAECSVGGFPVPRNTMLIVNAYAIQRDPAVWDDPLKFRPERFEGAEVDAYKLMPFGVGRRSCPGYGLGNRVVGITLASLIQCFEWKRVNEEDVDMNEGTGLTMPKAKPLEALCEARESMINILNSL